PLPLFPGCHGRPPPAQKIRAICAEGIAPTLDASRPLVAEADRLKLFDSKTGSPRWFSGPAQPVVWAAYSTDRIIVASPEEIVALDLAQGNILWRYGGGLAGKARARPDPFASTKSEARTANNPAT